jgi:hypothetical protein
MGRDDDSHLGHAPGLAVPPANFVRNTTFSVAVYFGINPRLSIVDPNLQHWKSPSQTPRATLYAVPRCKLSLHTTIDDSGITTRQEISTQFLHVGPITRGKRSPVEAFPLG